MKAFSSKFSGGATAHIPSRSSFRLGLRERDRRGGGGGRVRLFRGGSVGGNL
jgi:hypothetical protein